MSTAPNTPALSADLPAQVTLAAGHVTDSRAKSPAGAAAASPTGQDQPMRDGLGHACAELAALIPALIPALSRDSVPSALSAGRVVNPDVLHAMIILAAEIPAACAAARHARRGQGPRNRRAPLDADGQTRARPPHPRHPRRRMTGESPLGGP